MAGNKFATLLHRNTHYVAFFLVYAVLEWVLISLLLLNGLFSYLISRYVAFFGLKPSCIMCTRVDHLLEPSPALPHEMVCDDHLAEMAEAGEKSRRKGGVEEEDFSARGEGLRCLNCGVDLAVGVGVGFGGGFVGKRGDFDGDLKGKVDFSSSSSREDDGDDDDDNDNDGDDDDDDKEEEKLDVKVNNEVGFSDSEEDEEEEEDDDDDEEEEEEEGEGVKEEEEKTDVKVKNEVDFSDSEEDEEEEEEDDDDYVWVKSQDEEEEKEDEEGSEYDSDTEEDSEGEIGLSSEDEGGMGEGKDNKIGEKDDEEPKSGEVEEKKEREIEYCDRELRGFASADDSDHLFKHRSCKRVHGNDTIYKIISAQNDLTTAVTERVYKVESVHNRKEDAGSKSHSDVDDQESGRETDIEGRVVGKVGHRAYLIEIEDRAFFPSDTKKSVILTYPSFPKEDQIKNEVETTIKGERLQGSSQDGNAETKGEISPNVTPPSMEEVWNQVNTTSKDTSVETGDKDKQFPVLERTECHPSTVTCDHINGVSWEEKVASSESYEDNFQTKSVAVEDEKLCETVGSVNEDSSSVTPDHEFDIASHDSLEQGVTEPGETIFQERIAEMVRKVVMDGDCKQTREFENDYEISEAQSVEPQGIHRTYDRATDEVMSRSEDRKTNRVNFSDDRIASLYDECEEGQVFEEDYQSENESVSAVSIGSAISEQKLSNKLQNHEGFVSSNRQRYSPEGDTQDNMLENEATKANHYLSVLPEHNELEDEITFEHSEGSLNTNKKSGSLGADSMDGSVASEADSVETLTIEQLKSALKSERKALGALYAELEEERSASSIAANQTMAMITRLQEEKAAMNMEALQYQRMMEQQSEYDQEAVQMLDELAKKREKEKQDLMKELEVYRKKIQIYESREMEGMREEEKIDQGTSQEAENISLDLNEGDNDANKLIQDNGTSVSGILSSGSRNQLSSLNEELEKFEEERVTILEQLKLLEEKLFALDDTSETAGTANGSEADSASKLDSEKERLVIAEDMDNLYQRLHALEEDKAFLKQCISSLKKGDKEMNLLYEIFQHLRGLRNSERARNTSS